MVHMSVWARRSNKHTVGHTILSLFAWAKVSLSGSGSLLEIGEKRVLPLTIRCWGRVFRCPGGCKLCARAFLVTNKTFCIDQTKSLVELYALKFVTEMRKTMKIHHFARKPSKFVKISIFTVSDSHLSAYNSTKLFV